MKQFALVGADGEVLGVADTREEILAHIKADPLGALYFNEASSIVEFELNTEPLTETGKHYRTLIENYFIEQGVRQFRMNKQVGFYELSEDDRYKTIYEFITAPRSEPIDLQELDNYLAPKSKQDPVDLTKYTKEDGTIDVEKIRSRLQV